MTLKDLQVYKLLRFEQKKDYTKGYLLNDSLKICCTLEPGWNDNIKDNPFTKENEASCIPEGMYLCKKYSGTIHKNVWIITGIPGRSDVEIHTGNFAIQSKACVLVGEEHLNYKGVPILNNSQNTLNKLRTTLPNQFWLKVECDGFENTLSKIDQNLVTKEECQNVIAQKTIQRNQKSI